ncbi:lamin tail domain-containing protein, partial [Akkermansiaceae bacterium]|nr:lamin tail domain-containing protein [Akkermansiaceae bacterium]
YGESTIATTVSFGPTSAQKFPTTYFRKTISLSDTAGITGGTIRIKRDDGAVVYLNGTEVGRTSMPSGPIDYLTFANTASDDGRDFQTLNVSNTLFIEGENIIAVEVHQSTAGSSDLQFDLELSITRPAEGSSPLNMTENVLVRARSLDNGNWSALNEAFFNVTTSLPVQTAEVFPSEIHYNPSGPDDSEFIELHNQSGHAINLRGCYFSDGIDFTFPDNRDIPVAPGQRVLIVDSQFGIDATYGLGLPVVGVYRGNLNNGGETLTLMAPDGFTELFSVTFDGADPWPEEADGDGMSLVLTNPNDFNSPASWRPSLEVGGNPGGSDSTTFSGDPDVDADGDGVSAYGEYALGTDDSIANDANSLTTFLINENGHWEFTFPQALTADDAIASVEISNDLAAWNASTPVEASLTKSWVAERKLWRTYRSTNPTNGNSFFIRTKYRSLDR